MTTFIGYFGTYKVDGKTITVHATGASRPDWRNSTRTQTIDTLNKENLVFVNQAPDGLVATVTAKRC